MPVDGFQFFFLSVLFTFCIGSIEWCWNSNRTYDNKTKYNVALLICKCDVDQQLKKYINITTRYIPIIYSCLMYNDDTHIYTEKHDAIISEMPLWWLVRKRCAFCKVVSPHSKNQNFHLKAINRGYFWKWNELAQLAVTHELFLFIKFDFERKISSIIAEINPPQRKTRINRINYLQNIFLLLSFE